MTDSPRANLQVRATLPATRAWRSSPGRHCHSTRSLTAIGGHPVGIHTVVLPSSPSFPVKTTVPPRATQQTRARADAAGRLARPGAAVPRVGGAGGRVLRGGAGVGRRHGERSVLGGIRLARDESAIKCPSPLNVLKDTYD